MGSTAKKVLFERRFALPPIKGVNLDLSLWLEIALNSCDTVPLKRAESAMASLKLKWRR
jgi:hypothetical protein